MLDGNIVNFYIHRLHTMKAKLVVIAPMHDYVRRVNFTNKPRL